MDKELAERIALIPKEDIEFEIHFRKYLERATAAWLVQDIERISKVLNQRIVEYEKKLHN